MATNNRISTVVSNQLPEFVRADHPTFVSFLEAYFEYLEQSNTTLRFGKTVERAKNIRNYFDTDKITDVGLEEFNTHLYDQFLSLIPKDAVADKSKLLKNIKDFYLAKGTEKSYNFLFQLLFDEQASFYYPKTDILVASSGKWLIEKSVRIIDTKINNVSDDSIINLLKFKNTKLVGNTSTAEAQIEKVVISYENGVRFNEFFISKQKGSFTSGEQVFAFNVNNETFTGNLISGYISSIGIVNGGTGYTAGTSLPIAGDGSGGAAVISKVSSGNVSNVTVITGGAGFRVSDLVIFSGGGGSGANANVSAVFANGYHHPTQYAINSDIINTYNATTISAYSNSSGGNANTKLANTLNFFQFAGTGPIQSIQVLEGGSNYLSVPTVAALGNTRIKNLGIIGRLKINSPGSGYSNGARLIFTNVLGGFGFGANGNVVTNATGAIIKTNLLPLYSGNGHIIGGSGYNENLPPTISISGAGSGANITVDSLLGFGGTFTTAQGTLGVIEEVTVTNRGSGYTTAPTIDLTTSGSGTANLIANVVTGVFTYPGRFKDDTGLLSSSNYLENRDYYQNFSYVIKLKKSIEKYRKYVNELVHPTGMKLWGEYLYDSEPPVNQIISFNSYVSRTVNTTISNVIYYGYNTASNGGATISEYFTYPQVSTSIPTNTKTLTISFYINPDLQTAYHSNSKGIFLCQTTTSEALANLDNFGTTAFNRFQVYLTSSNTIGFYSQNTNSTTNSVFRMESNVENRLYSNTWYNIVASIDTANSGNCRIYINNVASYNVMTIYNSNVQFDFGSGTHYIFHGGAINNGNRFTGSLAHFWLSTNSALNISNTIIRRVFQGYHANGNVRVDYLGPNGNASLITSEYGVAPQLYYNYIVPGTPTSNVWVSTGLINHSLTVPSLDNLYLPKTQETILPTIITFVSNT